MTQSGSPMTGLMLNIVIPVLLLNRLQEWVPQLTSWHVLAIALSFPLFGAVQEFKARKKIGFLPVLGLLNVVGTGGLAALGVGGIWFAAKEAFFPLLIGLAVLGSLFLARRPLAEPIFVNETIFQTQRIRERLQENAAEAEFVRSLKIASAILGGSFLLSAALNFGLALHIFEPLAESLSLDEKTRILNQQVAKMTWMGFAVIALPSFVFTAGAFWHVVKELRRLTGLSDQEIFKS